MEQDVQNDWKVTVAILGARMHYAVPVALKKGNRLEKFFSDWYFPDNGIGRYVRNAFRYSPFNILRRVSLRFQEQLPSKQVRAFWFLGLAYAVSLRTAKSEKAREKIYEFFAEQFGAAVSRVGFEGARAVYGMNTASLELFDSAKRLGLACVLEQCSAPYVVMNRLYEEEYALWPDWEITQSAQFSDRLSNRESREWELADAILAGSPFVIENLVNLGVPPEKCMLVPYAVDVAEFCEKDVASNQRVPDRLNVLFLGGVGIRKGIQYLYTALKKLNGLKISARAAGNVLVRPEISNRLSGCMELLEMVPRSEVRSLLEWADVLVLPSVSEGSALVTYEALASGVPVITTPNSGSPVQHGITGFIVPNRNADAIAERLMQLAQNPGLRQDMSLQARKYAQEHLSWDAYSQRLIQAIDKVIYTHVD
jgi:glycosyltransferase involved in cell wall biosynthesis